MFQFVRCYEPVADEAGVVYQPRAYGERQPDATWDGWLVFVPAQADVAIAAQRETSQPSAADLVHWSASLEPVYLQGALERAIGLELAPHMRGRIAELSLEEREAAEDAIALETAAAEARADADAAAHDAVVHEHAAAAARAEARERLEHARAIEESLGGRSARERPRRS